MIKWIAGHNQPGYLPDSDPAVFDNRLDAVNYMIDEMERSADAAYEADNDTAGEEYESAALFLREHDADVDSDWQKSFSDGYVYWISTEESGWEL